MSVTVSLVNMKGGVGKTTLTFNLAWYCAWRASKKVLAIDLDPQANLSQYFLGARNYLDYVKRGRGTIVEIFEQYSAPTLQHGSPALVSPEDIIYPLRQWHDGSLIHLIPSRLELSWTLKNPTQKAELLPQFLSKVSDQYDLVIIDCAPTESILTTAAYRSSRYVIVPVRPEFLATIGLPLLARSINEHRMRYQNQLLEIAGIIFNGKQRSNTPPEQIESCAEVERLAEEQGWPVFTSVAYHSNSYPTGSRSGSPIFHTSYAKYYVKDEFGQVGEEFLRAVELR